MTPFPSALPEPRITPLRGGPIARWGVLAPGTIAGDWVTTLHANTDQRVLGVASRSAARAAAFASAHGIPKSFESHEALLADPDIDIVYIASVHTDHARLALLAIAAGKHVLVEKPIATNADDAARIQAAARGAGVFAMEAMWSRFLPQTDVIARLIADGVLGDLRWVTADFGAAFPYDPAGRAFDPGQGGGALLDLGVYSLWFAHFALGAPSAIQVVGSLAPTGVDAQATIALDYASGAQAAVSASMLARTPTTASVSGTLARVEVDSPFCAPGGFRLVAADDKRVLRYDDPSPLRWRGGLCYQATAVAQHLADGLLESPLHPLSASVAVLRIIDAARARLGAA